MDYYSVRGPIDPQIRNRDGRWVPGLGYLEKYNALVDKSRKGEITDAEHEFLIRKFDPAELFALEQAKTHSSDLIERWLCQYKFKDWTHRETDGGEVEDDYKAERAKAIAALLGDATHWNSHGRGIPLRVLESDQIKLKINNFWSDPDLNKVIREFYDPFIDYCGKVGAEVAIQTKPLFLALGG